MSVLTLSDGQRVETLNILKVELYEEEQNLLVTLNNGHIVGVHGAGVVNDANMLDEIKQRDLLTYSVYRKKAGRYQ